jgi:hypothetical protein
VTKTSIAVGLLATVAQYGLLAMLAHDARADTFKCSDTHNPWTLVISKGGTSASLWGDNDPSGHVRSGTYTTADEYTVVRFYDGWVRLKNNQDGDWTFGKLSGSFSCRNNAPAPAAPVAQAAPKLITYSYSRISSGRVMIHASGEIALNEADNFNAWLATLTPEQRASIRIGETTLVLDSPGGMIGGAASMAEWVKSNKVDTIVPNGSLCASACVMVWGAGYRKAAGDTARIGVHSAWSDETDADKQAGVAAVGTVAMARALSEEKAPAAIVAAVATTESNAMHWLSANDVVSWGGVMLDKDGMPQGQVETVAKAMRPTQIDTPSGLY